MDAGRLDQLITIEASTRTKNELGEEVDGWSYFARAWAKVMETPGREFLSGDYLAESKVVFCIRWRAIDSNYRVSWRERTYRIVDVTGTSRDAYAYLHCIAQDGAN